jgi:hypothetical protein
MFLNSIMFNSLKVRLGAVMGSVGLALAGVAHGQAIPTWDASSTELVVTASASAFKTTFVYVLQVMAPYAIIISLIVGLVWFFVRLARSH